jgi:hypothetical protein
MRSFLICAPRHILFRKSNQEEWDELRHVECMGDRRGAHRILAGKPE